VRLQEIELEQQGTFELTRLDDVIDEDLLLDILKADDLLLTFNGALIWHKLYGSSTDEGEYRMKGIMRKAGYDAYSSHPACHTSYFYYDPHAKTVSLMLRWIYQSLIELFSYTWTESTAKMVREAPGNVAAREIITKNVVTDNDKVKYDRAKHVNIEKLFISGQSFGRFRT